MRRRISFSQNFELLHNGLLTLLLDDYRALYLRS
ncbi:unnamed protein product [Callosobruchus maculatus]|uniref:Uncharacterized protein n=1 Tax=Callosobruchus maculatus TaxID=64391 RepID=A0A653DFZ3_CALMS|nr:unnamed protein product [Callosobruchus maculatus]VEN60156.1 unnamed protein product [Callosobruchus maculatus]